MYIAFDDTDSRNAMCTTYLTTEILARTGLDLIGYPRLVRLNPNIGYKTRGNGAVVMKMGRGKGKRTSVGNIDGKPVYSYAQETGNTYKPEILEKVCEVIGEFAELDDENTNPGAVVSRDQLSEDLYGAALSREVPIEDAISFISARTARHAGFKNGRGVIGASAAISWPRRKTTYELIAYTHPRPEPIDRNKQMEAAMYVERNFPETFNNVDVENGHASIFPSTRTPVLYGIRSVRPDRLAEIENRLRKVYGIAGSRSIIYETNQGTDDHIIGDPSRLWDTGSFSIKGEITGTPEARRGGHYFTSMASNTGMVMLAAFEPTKSFRHTFGNLRPGDIVEVFGSYSSGTLNVEKMRVISTSRYFSRVAPQCKICKTRMKTHGRNDFRCRLCGRREALPSYVEEERHLRPGSYEVPVSARRHLSMPLKLETWFRDVATVMERK